MNNIYTYEVDHGEEKPSIGAKAIINGGKLTSVCFSGQLKKNQKAREMLEDIFENEELDHILFKKLQVIQNLI